MSSSSLLAAKHQGQVSWSAPIVRLPLPAVFTAYLHQPCCLDDQHGSCPLQIKMLPSRAGNPMMQQYTVQLFQLEPDKQISLHCRHHKCSQCKVKAKHQGISVQRTTACHHHLQRGLHRHLCSGHTPQHPQAPLCSMLPFRGTH